MTGAADSRTGGRKQKTRVDSSGGARGVRRIRLRVPPLSAIPTKIALRKSIIFERETGAPLAEPFSRCEFWEARSSAHVGRVPRNSSSPQFGKSVAY